MPGCTILIADPEPEVRSLVKTVFRSEHYRVFEARGGLEALCVCACHPIDLLLVALDLPGIDGMHVAEKVSHPFPTMRVRYLSREAEAWEREDVIAKPLDAEALREKIHRALESPARKRPGNEPTNGEAAQRQSA